MKVKIREYDFDEHDQDKPFLVSLPKLWVRENLRPGDKVAVYQDGNRFLVEKSVEPKPNQ